MGADIHAYIEYDEFPIKDGEWHVGTFAKLSMNRNYVVFALLADVRHYPERMHGVATRQPKGEPPRWGLLAKWDYEGSGHLDWHSLSWMTVAEVEAVQADYERIGQHSEEKWTHGGDPELAAIIATMRALNGDDPERSRLVFWFDN